MKKYILDFLIPVIVAGIFTTLNFLDFYSSLENGLYDTLLHFKPDIPEQESILLIDIDDVAIARVGMFPWSRDKMADGLILMKEFEAAYAVFDILYTNESPRGVDPAILGQEIPEVLEEEFTRINYDVTELIVALQEGNIALSEAGDYIQYFYGSTETSKSILLESIGQIERNNDIYYGKAALFFENAFFSLNMQQEIEPTTPEELKQYALENITLKNIEVKTDFERVFPEQTFHEFVPSIAPIIKSGKRAGFVNVVVDNDGVRRRLDLINKYGEAYFTQLAFTPLLDWLGDPKVIVLEDRIILEAARLPDGNVKDIEIPLTEDKRVLINWPKKTFLESFEHISYWNLVLHDRQLANLIYNLKLMEELGYTNYYDGDFNLFDTYNHAENLKRDMLVSGDTRKMQDYRKDRQIFFKEVDKFLHGGTEEAIKADIDTVLASTEIDQETEAAYLAFRDRVPQDFAATREIQQAFMKTREILAEYLPGAFCIIGWTGTSTTDVGVSPFEEEYMNVGTHASLINTILAGMFLDDLPWWYSAAAAVLLSVLVTLIIRGLNPLPSIIIGIIFLIMIVGAGVAFFITTGIYADLLTPSLSVFFSFLVFTVFKFLRTEQEKSFLRNAFSHYLSTDVINDLLSDPDKLNLGGENKILTAMFTDIRGFSSISEVLDPGDLVKLLNAYLTEMSNTILELRGTIDKYEGDAIIAFFGAPVEFGDHAEKACLSALRMKKIEMDLNRHFLQEKISPKPLLTRIGINTGEMVVGNMGTIQKMDYTIMGNSVNLASRLEGVNKQYGTWILISEQTYLNGGRNFITRQMDRVRVVGINEPVRLYELVDEKSAVTQEMKEAIEIFHEGQELFEQKEWNLALKKFTEVLKIMPGDGPAETFMKRCKEYQKKTPPESWDGVFNLAVK